MTRLLVSLLAAAVALSACGGSDDGGTAPAPPQPASATTDDFPSVEGKTLAQLIAGLPMGAILNVSSFSGQRVGRNRLGFVIVDRANKQIDVSEVAVYTAKPDGTELRGPFTARRESLDVDTRYRSRQTDADLDSGDTFYVADAVYGSRGPHVAIGLVRLDGRLVVADPASAPLPVGDRGGPPDIGDRAIKVHTQTGADVGGDLTKLSTRIPPPREMLDTDFAKVVGRKPVVLVFATPALCKSRTCGPVVDIAEQVRGESGDGVVFIQQEIYQDNDPGKPYRSQVLAWGLKTEPWAFVIDRRGKVAARFEGVYSVGELARAVERVK